MSGKRLLSVLGSLLVAATLFAGGGKEKGTADAATQVRTGKYGEAPMLAAMVKAGTLPPVEKRLPAKPVVVTPLQEVGQYGGTWRQADVTKGGETLFMAEITEPLLRWNREGNAAVANVAESWDVSADGKTFTFHLVQGIKWSDGVPLTTDDILFWYEDILNFPALTKAMPKWLQTLSAVKKIDDSTVSFAFSKPYPLFLENIAYQGGGRATDNMIQPKHFLKDFHPKYVEEAKLTAAAKEKGFPTWVDYFNSLRNICNNVNVPQLGPWYLTSQTESEQKLTRNPYYWKVDTAGNQLPYIDTVVNEVVLNTETLTMKAGSGEYNFQPVRLSLSDYTFFKENEKKGNYKLLLWDTTLGSNFGLMPNLNHSDKVKKDLFNNRDFRVALSYAINRVEMNEIGYLNLAKARQASVIPGCPYFSGDLETMYADYNPAKANEMLDKILPNKGADGWRLRPDGKVLEITILTTPDTLYGPWPNMADLVAKYWKAVGIKTAYDALAGQLYSQRRSSPDFDVITWAYGRGLHPLLEPTFLFPYVQTTGAPQYALWYTSGGTKGEEPPAEMKALMKLYDEFSVTADDAKRMEIGKKIVRGSVENLWIIGTVGIAPAVLVRSNNFRNVPDKSLQEFILQQIAQTQAEQYYIKR